MPTIQSRRDPADLPSNGPSAARNSTLPLAYTRPAGLPDFEDPPVAEVVLGVTLDPLPRLRNAHLGQLWAEHYRDEFPHVEEHPSLPRIEERFDDEPGAAFQFEILDAPPPVLRQWYISPESTRLLQLQQDRFIHNWRRASQEEAYPRYESLRESFERHFDRFIDFLVQNALGSPVVRQAEINYVNQLMPDAGWQGQHELDRVIRMWRPDFGAEGRLTDPVEDVRLAQRHVIADERGPYARLYVAVEPVVGGGIVLNLTVRGRPRTGSVDAALEFFDMGRLRIVNAFAAVTTDAMHTRWGRRPT